MSPIFAKKKDQPVKDATRKHSFRKVSSGLESSTYV